MFTQFKIRLKEQKETVFSAAWILEAVKGSLLSGVLDNHFTGVSIDSRTIKKGEIFIAIKGDRFDGHDFIPQALGNGAECLIISKDKTARLLGKLPQNIISVDNTLCALWELAYHYRKTFDIPIICVTGSNGKTTTKEMLYSLLSSKYEVLKNEGTQNNVIGLSLSVLNLRPSHDIAVLELGTNHFGEIGQLARIAAPSIGVITNIAPAHLESFKDIEGVLKEKWSLIEDLSFPRIAFMNADDELLNKRLSWDTVMDANFFSFGIKNKADFMARNISIRRKKLNFMIKNYPIELNTLARHNAYNAVCAYGVARIFSIDAFDAIKRFKEFQFPKARFQVKRMGGLNIIDDAYNANPASFHHAIESFKDFKSFRRKILVLGDMLELGSMEEDFHRRLGEELGRSDIDLLIAVGPLSHIACDVARFSGFNPNAIYKCSSIKEAKSVIIKCAKKDDTVLLKGSRAMMLEEIFK